MFYLKFFFFFFFHLLPYVRLIDHYMDPLRIGNDLNSIFSFYSTTNILT